MKMVTTNDGKKKFLASALAADPFPGEGLIVRLFQNDYTPVDASVTANFTQATFTNYSQVDISTDGFSAPVIVGNFAESQYASPPTYECTGGAEQTVYGWYLEGDSSGLTYLTQRFNTPRVMGPGAVETLDPFKIRLKTLV